MTLYTTFSLFFYVHKYHDVVHNYSTPVKLKNFQEDYSYSTFELLSILKSRTLTQFYQITMLCGYKFEIAVFVI